MGADAFKAARDFLLAHRTDYRAAHAGFRWPELDRFNYALDWFDVELARGANADRIALKIVGDGAATATFGELSERSNRIANGLRALGVQRGERILLMLGNVVPLWEVMLAAMKLGAVVIPATTLLTPNDLKDRFERGRVRHLIANAADAPKFAGLDPSVTRIALGDAPAGWHGYADLLRGDARFTPDGETRATDPMLLYFTSGTTSRPKLVEHSHQSYPVGHLITMYWIGLQPGDMHLNISSPGWAKHAYSCLFAPWNAGATVFIANQPRFNARGMLDGFIEVARRKVPRFTTNPLANNMVVQVVVAEADAKLESARVYLLQTLRDSEAAAMRRGELSLDERMKIRAATTHAIRLATRVVEQLYELAGSTAIFEGNPFERRFRDAHTVSQHAQGRISHLETVGKHLLGIEQVPRFV